MNIRDYCLSLFEEADHSGETVFPAQPVPAAPAQKMGGALPLGASKGPPATVSLETASPAKIAP